MKISKGDSVKVLSGKDKGTIAKVLVVLKKKGSVIVEGVNIYKRHQKGEVKGKGEIVLINKPIDISNVKKYEEVKPQAIEKDAPKPERQSTKKQSTKKTSTKPKI